MGVCGAAQLAARSNRQGKAQGQREDYVTGRRILYWCFVCAELSKSSCAAGGGIRWCPPCARNARNDCATEGAEA